MKEDNKKKLAERIDKMDNCHLKERLKKELEVKSKLVKK